MCTFIFFFFNDTATTEIYTLSLHDALPILLGQVAVPWDAAQPQPTARLALTGLPRQVEQDRKSTRLNSSHVRISYAVFCLKKKNTNKNIISSKKKKKKKKK